MQKQLGKILRTVFVATILLSGSALLSQTLIMKNGQKYLGHRA